MADGRGWETSPVLRREQGVVGLSLVAYSSRDLKISPAGSCR